jgi:Zn-finger nucleic acid-binding protein
MHVPRITCPRCDRELEEARLRQVEVRLCTQCRGSLLEQVRLSPLLEALSTELTATIDPDARLAPVADPGRRVACPSCRKTMDSDDYCAAGVVSFDRCNTCRLLWLDSDDLGTMTIMWARMNLRQARDRALIASQTPAVVVINRSHLGIQAWRILAASLLGVLGP